MVQLRKYHKGEHIRELYNLHDDPAEQINLLKQQPKQWSAMRKTFDTFFKPLEAARDPKPVDNTEDKEALRALGYIQ
jgi:hypothetical protein